MSYTALRNTSSTISRLLIIVLLLSLVAQTGNIEFDLGKDKDVRYVVGNVTTIIIDPTQMDLDNSAVLSIRIYDEKYHTVLINFTRINYFETIVQTDKDYEVLAAQKVVLIDKNKIQIGSRVYEHALDFSLKIHIHIVFSGSGYGRLKISFGSENNQLIPTNYGFSAPDPLNALGQFYSFLGIVWNGMIVFFNLVASTINIVWNIIVFVFGYVNIILDATQKYILPNLALFLGVYFFATLGMAVSSIPKKGFEALIDWGKLWYSHIMALVNFIKMLAEWAYKLINIIIKLVDTITPFT